MKAFGESPPALAGWAGLILLFDGEVDPAPRDHDEHNQTDILTWGLNLAPAFPVLMNDQWLWEFVARYSGATVPDSHRVS